MRLGDRVAYGKEEGVVVEVRKWIGLPFKVQLPGRFRWLGWQDVKKLVHD